MPNAAAIALVHHAIWWVADATMSAQSFHNAGANRESHVADRTLYRQHAGSAQIQGSGADRPVIVPCTLLPYAPEFELGHTLAEAFGEVRLNHPHCARFCVLGGASCGG